MAASIFSIIDGLTVDRDDILEAETFTEQYLSAQFPTYDFRKGTALRDMTVRPNATLLALVNKAIKHYFDETDIINITDDTDKDVVNSRLSNFFLSRRSGDNAVIRARLYFSFPTPTPISVLIPGSATFSVDNEIQFSTTGQVAVNPDPGVDARDPNANYFIYDGAEDMHYVDVDMKADTPNTDANLEEGDLLYFTLFSPYIISGEILYLVESAIEEETNTEMIERAYSSISTRNLINTPSIISRISDQFNYAGEILPVGLGSPHLYRDIVSITSNGESQPYHRGGHVDIYIDTPLVTQRLQFTLDENSKFKVEGPVINIRRSPVSQSGKDEDTVPLEDPYKYLPLNVSKYDSVGVPVVPELDFGYSNRQITEVEFPLAPKGSTVTMDVVSYSGLGSISDAINSRDQRVVCADYMTRAFEPVILNVSVVTRGSSNNAEAGVAIQKYIEGIPAGGSFYMANLISIIQDSGVENFIMPISVTAVEENRYREFDTYSPELYEEPALDVKDMFSLRPTQMFRIGSVTLSEVVAL